MDDRESLDIFSKNFKKLRESRGLGTVELAEKLDVSQSTISTWENGRKLPRAEAFDRITRFFNISLSELMSNNDDYTSRLTIKIPAYGSVAAGALAEIEGQTVGNVKNVEIPISFLGKHANDKGLFMMKVEGDSMNKIIPDRSFVIAKMQEHSEFKDGDLVIFSHDNGYSLKRFLPHAVDGSILFKAETTDNRIKDIVVPFDTCNDLKIYAKVIWYSITLD